MSDSYITTPVWSNYSSKNTTKTTSSDSLGKDQFLSILVAQMQNQDPMNPMSDTDFIAQMAQFSSVEQLMGISSELTLLRSSLGNASNLIGKTVMWNQYDSAGKVEQLSGVVDSVVSSDGKLYVEVGGKLIDIDYIGQVFNTPVNSDSPNDTPTEDSSSEDTTVGDTGNSSDESSEEVNES